MAASPYCPRCGAANPPEEETCFACGGALATTPGTLPELGVQRVLRQRYRLLRQIGVGGFGAVYQAEDTQLGQRLVAVKEMRARGLTAEEEHEATEAFHREALLLARLSHPNLPRIYEQFEDDGRWYLVMDFIAGQTLEEELAQRDGSLPVKEALQLSLHLSGVLDYLHSSQPPIVFRDLKPSNVMRTPDGHIYLIDFGIARLFKPGQTKDTIAFGSPGYAAPEQYGKAQTTPRSDVFSLGALLHQLLTGIDPSETPFRFQPLTMPRPAGVSTLVERMVDLDDVRRPATMDLVRQDLERILSDPAPWHTEEQHVAPSGPSLTPTLATTGAYPSLSPAAPSWPRQSVGATMPGAPVLHLPGANKKSRWGRWMALAVVAFVGFLLVTSIFHPNTQRREAPSSSSSADTPSVSFVPVVPVFALSWSPDGNELAYGGADGKLAVVDTISGQRSPLKTNLAQIYTLSWSPDGAYLAAGGAGGHIQIWHGDGKLAASYAVTATNINALSWSPDSKRIVLASNNGIVEAVDALTGGNGLIYEADTEPVSEVAWSPDGRYLAFVASDQEVHVWESTTEKEVYVYHDNQTGIDVFAWSPESGRIASADAYGQVQVWDATTGGNRSTYASVGGVITASSGINALAWSPNGRYLASGNDEDSEEIWELGTTTPLYTYIRHTDVIRAVAWSPDSERIASASDDGTVEVRDALTGGNEQTYQLV